MSLTPFRARGLSRSLVLCVLSIDSELRQAEEAIAALQVQLGQVGRRGRPSPAAAGARVNAELLASRLEDIRSLVDTSAQVLDELAALVGDEPPPPRPPAPAGALALSTDEAGFTPLAVANWWELEQRECARYQLARAA